MVGSRKVKKNKNNNPRRHFISGSLKVKSQGVLMPETQHLMLGHLLGWKEGWQTCKSNARDKQENSQGSAYAIPNIFFCSRRTLSVNSQDKKDLYQGCCPTSEFRSGNGRPFYVVFIRQSVKDPQEASGGHTPKRYHHTYYCDIFTYFNIINTYWQCRIVVTKQTKGHYRFTELTYSRECMLCRGIAIKTQLGWVYVKGEKKGTKKNSTSSFFSGGNI